VRRRFYVPLMISLPVSLSLTVTVVVATALGWIPAIVPIASGETGWIEALARIPQIFVVSVCACWLLFGLSVPFFGRWSGSADN
jgi:hypothetical protein